MTRAEAEELLHLFSACGFWVRTVPLDEERVCLEVRDDAIYGRQWSFDLLVHAQYVLLQLD